LFIVSFGAAVGFETGMALAFKMWRKKTKRNLLTRVDVQYSH